MRLKFPINKLRLTTTEYITTLSSASYHSVWMSHFSSLVYDPKLFLKSSICPVCNFLCKVLMAKISFRIVSNGVASNAPGLLIMVNSTRPQFERILERVITAILMVTEK